MSSLDDLFKGMLQASKSEPVAKELIRKLDDNEMDDHNSLNAECDRIRKMFEKAQRDMSVLTARRTLFWAKISSSIRGGDEMNMTIKDGYLFTLEGGEDDR